MQHFDEGFNVFEIKISCWNLMNALFCMIYVTENSSFFWYDFYVRMTFAGMSVCLSVSLVTKRGNQLTLLHPRAIN